MTLLQVALDFFELEKAVEVAKKLDGSGVNLLEAGTPLIISQGLSRTLEALRTVSSIPIVADLKIVDVGYEVASLAFEAGAKGVSVLALAPEETIRNVRKACDEHGGYLLVDLLGCEGELLRCCIRKALKHKPDFLLVHLGIDVQRKRSILEFIADFLELIPRDKLGVAGGITLDVAKKLLQLEPALIVVGRAIAKATAPRREALKFVNLIHRQ